MLLSNFVKYEIHQFQSSLINKRLGALLKASTVAAGIQTDNFLGSYHASQVH